MNELKSHLLKLTQTLQEKNLTIATAESCTGGLIASLLTEQPGSSTWFERGFVTYSNLSKHDMLGVDLEMIKTFGAVSKEVAEAMVKGALDYSKADLALAVTGIAGPAGGSIEKPVGTVYLAFCLRNKSPQVNHYHFKKGTRESIRSRSCQEAFLGLLSVLEEES